MNKKFSALIFDLDDTLLDTTNQLTRPSFEFAFTVMVQHGLNSNVENCFVEREHTLLKYTRDQLLHHLVSKFGVNGPKEACLSKGYEAFQSRLLETDITINPGVLTVLRELSDIYSLFLVTAGTRLMQKRKVELLNINPYFKHIFYVETSKGQRKRDAFLKILNTLHAPAEKLLSIGNRLNIEISESKELGLKTCHIRKGEYRCITPRTHNEIPDYTINEISEITKVCHL